LDAGDGFTRGKFYLQVRQQWILPR
jgi:hypothetical protein